MKKPLLKLFVILMAIFTLPAAAAAQGVRVAVMPFQIYSEKDFTSLQKGVVDMMIARLAAPHQVTVIDPLATSLAKDQAGDLTGDSLAMSVGTALKADFILQGSMTIVGESISIDAKMIDVKGMRPPLTVFKQARGMGELIPQLNLLATDIASQAFGRKPPETEPAAIAAPTSPEKPPEKKKKLDIHAHPEKLLEELRSGSDEE